MGENLSKPLSDMLSELSGVDDETWGLYSFSQDPLKNKISQQDKRAWSREAVRCGSAYALKVMEQCRTGDAFDIADKMGLDVKIEGRETVGDRVIFAKFVPPKRILIMDGPIKKAQSTLESLEGGPTRPVVADREGNPLKEHDLVKIILSHEIFHFVEEKYRNEIFTRTKKVTLWTLPLVNFKYTSTILALGEIGAMSFARTINDLPFPPYLLDVLLCYSYNPNASYSIYNKVMDMASQA